VIFKLKKIYHIQVTKELLPTSTDPSLVNVTW